MATDFNTVIGKGPLIPFRRLAGDVVAGTGADELRSSLLQLLLTQKGELRWRPDFGIDLDQYRHKNDGDESLYAQMEGEVSSAIAQFEPRVDILNIAVRKVESGKVEIRLQWQAVSRTRRGTTTLGTPELTQVQV